MSTDDLRRHLNRHLDFLRTLQGRGLPPVSCIRAWIEGDPPTQEYTQRHPDPLPACTPSETLMTDALFHPGHRVTGPRHVTTHFGSSGSYATLLMTLSPRDPMEEVHQLLTVGDGQADLHRRGYEALGVVEQVRNRLAGIEAALPTSLVERLGLDRYSRTHDWLALLFHLGWHFPAHGIEVGRYRILAKRKNAPWDFFCSELNLQLGGVRVAPDVYPGVMLSRLVESTDFLTASVNALLLILEALDGLERDAQPQPSAEFARLHEVFSQQAEMRSHHPHELSVKVLRLANSFRTPPATEWAGINRGGDGWGIPTYHILSQAGSDRVVCEVRGLGAELFHELANRAGALLPQWPAQQYPAVLNDVSTFARYCDPARYPATSVVGDAWNRGMVTDHRGNVERWLGLVFALLMRHRLEYLDLVTRPAELPRVAGYEPVNAMLSLRGINPFAACARALELAELIPTPTVSSPPPLVLETNPNSSAAHTPAEQIPMDRQPTLVAEIEQLLTEARRAYADTKLQFTLVAIPYQPPDCDGKMQRCDDDSPDVGHVRDGVFYWPLRSVHSFGVVSFGDHGRFVLYGLDRGVDGMLAFSEFGGRAAAALFAAAPPWFGVRSPGSGFTIWAATVIFGAPSVRDYAQRQPTGPWILRNPWAASITALNDILAPGERSSQDDDSAGNTPARVRCDDTDRSVYLDCRRIAGEVDVAVYRFFKAIAEAYPDPISFKTIKQRATGLHGKHPTRDLRDRLPAGLAPLVDSGKHGYSLKLPAPK